MEKPEKSPLKTNSSVPDIVFYQLKLDKEEKVLGFIDNDSEEHFGKLARQGGEILLPGVFPQKTKPVEDLGKHADGQAKKGKLKVKMDIPTSDTELETILFYGRSSSSELKFLKKESERMKKFGSSDNEMSQMEMADEKNEQDKKEEKYLDEVRGPEEFDIKTFLINKSYESRFSDESQLSKPENLENCESVQDEARDLVSEAVPQAEESTEEADAERFKPENLRK